MFSVVIPTHNRSEKLLRAINSVRSQFTETWEIIVVDDASCSEEAERIAFVVADCPDARLIRLDTNVGGGEARNIGVAAAQFPFIAFLDSDDWWAPDRLAHHRRVLEQPGVVASYNPAYLKRSVSAPPIGIGGGALNPVWRTSVAVAAWNSIGGCSSVCVGRRAFARVRGFDASMRSCQDWDLWLRLTQEGAFAYVPKPLTYCDIGCHVRVTTSREAIESGHDQMYRLAEDISVDARERRYVAAMHLWVKAEIALRFGDRKQAVTLAFRSLQLLPTRLTLGRAPAVLLKGLSGLGLSAKEQPLGHDDVDALVAVDQFGDLDIARDADQHIGVVARHPARADQEVDHIA